MTSLPTARMPLLREPDPAAQSRTGADFTLCVRQIGKRERTESKFAEERIVGVLGEVEVGALR